MAKFLPNAETDDLGSLEAFSKIRLIALDVDGTLQGQGAETYNTLEQQFNKLQRGKKKVSLTLATGRTLNGVKNQIERLPIRKDVPLILYNGGLAVRNQSIEVCFRRTISLKSLNECIAIGYKTKTTVLAYFFSAPFELEGIIDHNEWVQGWSNGNRKFKNEFNGIAVQWMENTQYNSNIEPIAILVTSNSGEIPESDIAQYSKIQNISLTNSGGKYLEIRPQNSDKGKALKAIAELLDLERGQVLAMGDGDNDAEMLSWAGIGISVSRASKEAINASDFTCRHSVAEGVIEVLRLIIHARRFF